MHLCHAADHALNACSLGEQFISVSLASGTHFPLHAERLRVSSARPESQLLFMRMWEER